MHTNLPGAPRVLLITNKCWTLPVRYISIMCICLYHSCNVCTVPTSPLLQCERAEWKSKKGTWMITLSDESTTIHVYIKRLMHIYSCFHRHFNIEKNNQREQYRKLYKSPQKLTFVTDARASTPSHGYKQFPKRTDFEIFSIKENVMSHYQENLFALFISLIIHFLLMRSCVYSQTEYIHSIKRRG